MKFLNFFYFCGSFLPSWTNSDSESGSTDLINPDPNPSITGADIGACWGRRTRWRACWPRHAAQSGLISPLSQSSGRGRWCFPCFPSYFFMLLEQIEFCKLYLEGKVQREHFFKKKGMQHISILSITMA